MSTMWTEVYHKLHPILEDLVDITCDHIEAMERLPEVELIEGDNEELFINGQSVCRHKRLYPVDILDVLDKYNVIVFKRGQKK